MSNELNQGKHRLKFLANSDVKKQFVNNKWRRLCSIDKCEKQSQRKGLCTRHLTENKRRQCSAETIAVSHPSLTHSMTKELDTISKNPGNLLALTENHIEQSIFNGYRKVFSVS